ncbi:MAG: aspartate--tRNA(Asn) ligase [Clostridiales bacterium]|nr:aspartate--tRNA(Asn) ligase [Clostridiales bacterium]
MDEKGKKAVSVKQLLALSESERLNARVSGMVYSVRDMKDFAFIILRLSDGVTQCVFDKTSPLPAEESAITVVGEMREDARAANGFEILIKSLTVLSAPSAETPLAVSKRKLNIALENELPLRPVTLRNEERRGVFKLREGIVRGMRRYFEDNDFTEILTPKIVASGAEGGANIFRLDYFGQKAYLAQSPQFYKQTLIPVYSRVFEIAPAFRAEKHNTARHLNEYISVDFEMGFIDSFYDLIDVETEMLRSTFAYVREHYAAYVKPNMTLPEITEIPRMSFSEIKERVAEKYDRKIRDPYDLEPEEERLIGRYALEELGCDFIFVTHYPAKKRPFYAKDDPENPKFTLSFDLLFKGLEITTGGQRIHDYDEQIAKMRLKGLNPDDFESYLMLHKYGCPPHGGLGIGLERLMLQITGEQNVRAVSMFPRDTTRITP